MKRRIVSSLVAAMAMGVMAETVNTVTVTKFNQSYPYAGKATVEYTVGGPLPANAWSSTGISGFGRALTVSSNNFIRSILPRSAGRSVRPVRDAD